MEGVLLKYIKESSLPKNLQELFIKVCDKKISKDKYLTVGDASIISKKAEDIYNDLKEINVSKRIYACLFYYAIYNYSEFDKNVYEILINEVLFNDELREAIISIPNSNSGYVSFVKAAGPLIRELLELMKNKKSYMVLKKYKEIIDLCNRQGIPEMENDELLQIEIDKRFPYNSLLKYLPRYKKFINNLEFDAINNFNFQEFRRAKSCNYESIILQKILHGKMLEYYYDTNCFFVQYNEDINLYYLADILIVAYKYDDVAKMALKRPLLTLTWDIRDFWAKIFNPDMRFLPGNDINYFISGKEEKDSYKVSSSIYNYAHLAYGKRIIFAPEEYIDEAFFKTLDDGSILQLRLDEIDILTRYGFDYEKIKSVKGNLMSTDNTFYFKNPLLVDELRIKNIEKYKTLSQIIAKKDSKSRKACIRQIRVIAEKKPHPENKPMVFNNRSYRKYYDEKRRYLDDDD